MQTLIVLLMVASLCSSFGVVYFKDLNRRLFIQYETLQHEKAEKLIKWERLLLEQSTWSTQSRIQKIAQRQLGMEMPNAKEIVLVNAKKNNPNPPACQVKACDELGGFMPYGFYCVLRWLEYYGD